jgi:hypothetical protein
MGGSGACPPKCPRFWVTGEYLMWRFQDAPLPVLLLTQGDTVAATAAGLPVGAIGTPGTQGVSPGAFHFGNASGGRMEFGGWLDSDRWLGCQVGAFGLQQKMASFSTSSPTDVTSTTVLAVPFINANGAESAIQLSDATTGVNAMASIQNQILLWGTEGNALFHVYSNNWFSFGMLGGVRYLDLEESLNFNVDITGTAVPGSFSNFTDRFAARNQFYGGQVGGRVEFRWDGFFVNVTGKAALGPVHQAIAINGVNTNNVTTADGSTVTVPIGIFAQSSNIGKHDRDELGFVPEVQAQVGYQACRWFRIFAGYNYLWISSVVRPGNQIDRQFNPSNFPAGAAGTFPGPFLAGVAVPPGVGGLPANPGLPAGLTTPFHPSVPFNASSFWAQGLNVGVEIRF